MVRRFLPVFFVFISIAAFSQSDFRPGFVVTNQLDTIKGLVDFRDGSAANEVCSFKKSSSEAAISYYPGDIRIYGFMNDKVMESRQVVVEKTEKSVFLEVVVRGTVTLFKLNDTFWVEKQGSGFHQLSNNIAAKYSVDDRTKVRNDNRHIATLNIMMHDCAKVKNDVEKVQLNRRSLTSLVEKYNKCAGDVQSVVYQEKKPWAQAKFGLVAGVNFSRLNTNTNGVSDWQTSPTLGATMDVYFPRAGERVAFTTGLLYYSATYDYSIHTVRRSGSKEWVVDDYFEFDTKQLELPLGARYTFPGKKFLPYVNVGIAFVGNLTRDVSWKQEITFNSEVDVTYEEYTASQLIQTGFWAGVGVLTPLSKKLSGVIEIRAEKTNGASGSSILKSSSSIANYKFVVGLRMK